MNNDSRYFQKTCYGLWYNPLYNRFLDEDGNILHDFYDLFDVWQLDVWKKTKAYGVLTDKRGNLCEIYYLDPEDDGKLCDHDCEVCRTKCPAYSLWRDWKSEYFEGSYILNEYEYENCYY